MTTTAFLLHPLGERDADFGSARGDNLANAMLWFRAIKEATRWAICYPVMAYLAALDEIHYGPSILTDQIEIMKRLDVVVLAGGRMSPHMRYMLGHAVVAKIPVANLLDLGPVPIIEGDRTRIEILRRADALDP